MHLLRSDFIAAFVAVVILPMPASSQQALTIKKLASLKVAVLPAGPLFWRLENFPTPAQAQAAATATSLAVESGGKAWLITLGPAGGASPGGTKVTEIGPLPPVSATNYLLQVNEASGPPGSVTPQHSHPGSETFYVLSGQSSSRTSDGSTRVDAGHGMVGHAADTPMEVSSSGTADLVSLVMFVVDADKPFSSPAKLP
jgi:quercetin dioxygenase-like cupin family protein